MNSRIKKEDKPASAVRQMGKAFDEAVLGAKALLEYKRRMAHENQLSY